MKIDPDVFWFLIEVSLLLTYFIIREIIFNGCTNKKNYTAQKKIEKEIKKKHENNVMHG